MAAATLGVNLPSWRSLEWRLTLLIAGSCLAALVAVLYLAFLEVSSTLHDAAAERAGQATRQVAGLLTQSAAQSVEQMRGAVPAVRAALADPTTSKLDAARARLAPLAAVGNRRVTLWSADGTLALDLPEDSPPGTGADDLPSPLRAPPPGIGPMQALGTRAITDMALPIQSDDPARRPLGTLALRAGLAINPPGLLNRLVGQDARVLFGNRAGDVWTDATRLSPGPQVDLSTDGARTYDAGAGDVRIGAVGAVPGTPWVAWVEFPEREITTRANHFLRRMAGLAFAIAGSTALLSLWFSRRLTTPLAQMTTAAEAIAGGDFSRRVATGGTEIGRLGHAFNTMSAEVANAHQRLEQRVVERTEELNTALAALDHRSRERENYLATIVDSSLDAIIGKDLDGRVTSWNRGAEQIFGYTASEVIGRPSLFLVPRDRRDEEAAILHTIRRGGTVGHFTTVRQAKDGRLLDVSLTISPIRDAAGQIVGVSKVARNVTAAKEAEARLVEREQQLSLYAEHSPVAVAMFDVDMCYLVASTRWIEDFKLGDTPLIGRSHYEVFPGLPEHWKAIHRRCLAGASEKRDEEQFVRADGSISWIRWEVKPWRQADGAIGGLIIFSEDITARKHAEERLSASEDRYRTLFDWAPDGIVISDTDGYYLDANPSVCDMLGYHRGELVGLHATDIVSSSEVDHIEPALTTIAGNLDYQREWTLRRRDGTTFQADVIATRMPDGLILGMLRDVTERNRAIEAVRAAEERMRFALESAEVGIWDADYRTGVVVWSPILERQHGLEPGTFAGTFEAFMAGVHPEDRATVSGIIDRAVKSGQDYSMQHRVIWPDGSVRWLTVAGRVHLDAHGKALRATGVSIDNTDRRQLEAQFQQAQKMEAIGRLAGGVAHDFNNLLTIILGNCELLATSVSDARTLRQVIGIETAASQAAGLTRQLLAFSRKQIIEPTLVDLNKVIGDLRKMLGRLIGEDITVVVDLPPDVGPVLADHNQIEQVVMNLAVNARDAMPSGGTLTLQTANVDLDEHYAASHFGTPPGSYVVLTCSDTGTGMTPEVQARLFEPFFTTKEMGKGTGLGLATVHGIVKRSGGSIGVYSEPGKGSSFKVYFPRVENADVVAPAIVKAPVRGGAETVLVVEDADLLRTVTKELLERLGYTVLTAENAGAAITVFDQHPEIAVLLTDVVMPGSSGPELTEQLTTRRPELKVVFMSGYTEEAMLQHRVAMSGAAFLHKPFNSDALGRAIRNALAT
ncbi:MAG: PAS domain S-box protein [Vicinamibacterales bacterium]